MNQEQMKAEIARLKAENEALAKKAAEKASIKASYGIGDKGEFRGVTVNGRYYLSLGSCETILGDLERFKAAMVESRDAKSLPDKRKKAS